MYAKCVMFVMFVRLSYVIFILSLCYVPVWHDIVWYGTFTV